jgi:hypothetical protein
LIAAGAADVESLNPESAPINGSDLLGPGLITIGAALTAAGARGFFGGNGADASFADSPRAIASDPRGVLAAPPRQLSGTNDLLAAPPARITDQRPLQGQAGQAPDDIIRLGDGTDSIDNISPSPASAGGARPQVDIPGSPEEHLRIIPALHQQAEELGFAAQPITKETIVRFMNEAPVLGTFGPEGDAARKLFFDSMAQVRPDLISEIRVERANAPGAEFLQGKVGGKGGVLPAAVANAEFESDRIPFNSELDETRPRSDVSGKPVDPLEQNRRSGQGGVDANPEVANEQFRAEQAERARIRDQNVATAAADQEVGNRAQTRVPERTEARDPNARRGPVGTRNGQGRPAGIRDRSTPGERLTEVKTQQQKAGAVDPSQAKTEATLIRELEAKIADPNTPADVKANLRAALKGLRGAL